ncbi:MULTISPECIES: hypothetical protein [unclassified Microcoleus]
MLLYTNLAGANLKGAVIPDGTRQE